MTLPTSRLPSSSISRVSAQELILCEDSNIVCETYIFEPSAGEEKLGSLFAAAEVEDRGGVGKELVDVVIAAIQNEYFRDRGRTPIQSFELALHQANLILHDAAERGVRDWMGYFHVAIGALADKQLHVSVAGNGNVWLARKAFISCISDGLSHLPITNPLRTFSQVASGEVTARDVVLFATGSFPDLFNPEDVVRFTIDHSADTVTARLQQLYRDQHHTTPVAMVTAALLPDYVARAKEEAQASSFRPRTATSVPAAQLKPRQPIKIYRPTWQRTIVLLWQGLKLFFAWVGTKVWPAVWSNSLHVGGKVGKSSAKLLQAARQQPLPSFQGSLSTMGGVIQNRASLSTTFSTMRSLPSRLLTWVTHMPITSKIFAIVAAVLLVTLLVSLQMLQQKRATDQEIQQAAELLHEAQTKKEAASTALIYNNREQAKTLLEEAKVAVDEVAATGFYANEIGQLRTDIETQQDRLQKITRVSTTSMRIMGDFSPQLAGTSATSIFFVDEKIFSYNPSTNAIVAMDATGNVSVVSEQTKEIGFFQHGVAQLADKTILLATSDPGLALFDTKDNSLRRQDIALPPDTEAIGPMSLFGNRLYMFEAKAANILTFNKTLRGFVGGIPWITDSSFPASSLQSLAVDGNIYTLHTNGAIHRLFKGAPAEFSVDTVEPKLTTATKIFTHDELSNIYVLDTNGKRVVVFTKKGALVRQIFLPESGSLQDLAVDGKETTLYLLADNKVVSISLIESTPTPTP